MGASAAVAVFALGTGIKALSARQAGKGAQNVAEFNAQIAEMKASDAIVRGRETESRHRANTRRLIGSQRAAFAASGVVVDDADSTAVNVLADTAQLSEMDALTIRANAAREAWGFRMGAQDQRVRGEIARREGDSRAMGEIIGGAGSILYGKYGFGGGSTGGGSMSSGQFGLGGGV